MVDSIPSISFLFLPRGFVVGQTPPRTESDRSHILGGNSQPGSSVGSLGISVLNLRLSVRKGRASNGISSAQAHPRHCDSAISRPRLGLFLEPDPKSVARASGPPDSRLPDRHVHSQIQNGWSEPLDPQTLEPQTLDPQVSTIQVCGLPDPKSVARASRPPDFRPPDSGPPRPPEIPQICCLGSFAVRV